MAVVKQIQKFLSKESILEYFTEEEIMGMYANISPTSSLFCSPFRVDRNSSCSIGYYKGRYVYKDWGLGFTYNCFEIAGLRLGIIAPTEDPKEIGSRFYLILQRVHDELVKGKNLPKIDNHIQTIQSKDKKQRDIKVVLREWNSEDLAYWQLSAQELNKYNVYPISYVLLDGECVMNTSVANPIYGYYFGTEGKRQIWKIYRPNSNKFNTHKWLYNGENSRKFKTW